MNIYGKDGFYILSFSGKICTWIACFRKLETSISSWTEIFCLSINLLNIKSLVYLAKCTNDFERKQGFLLFMHKSISAGPHLKKQKGTIKGKLCMTEEIWIEYLSCFACKISLADRKRNASCLQSHHNGNLGWNWRQSCIDRMTESKEAGISEYL